MSRNREIITAVGALACAVGIGLVMQSSDKAEQLYGKAAPAEAPAEDIALPDKGADASDAMLTVEGITLTSGEYASAIALPTLESQVVTVSAPQSTLPEPQKPEAPAGIAVPACEIEAHARPVAAAMVELTMSAPCLPDERVTVHHNGMIITETTSATGTLDVKVPALTRDAVFVLAFTNGDGAVTQTTVEDLQDFDRVVLQWKGETGFQIHAREFGAGYDSPGHVWAGAPGDVSDAIAGRGGMLTRHGDTDAADPLLADVYTFPRAATKRGGDIALSVETEVNAANCDMEIEAQTLEIVDGARVKAQDLTLAVPDCDAVGSFLVLNNLLQDLKVAQR
jgi:hypothetical protein